MKISIVGGGGRVGLPLALMLALNGNEVIVVDTDENRVNKINNRVMPFYEAGAEDALLQITNKNLSATTSNEGIANSDVCILIIGTPVNNDGVPSAGHIGGLVKELSIHLQATKLIMLRSTVYPGITEQIQVIAQELIPKIQVSFCPERIVEGKAFEEMRSLPQIIGVETDEAFEISKQVFYGISPKFIRTSFKEAEVSKLFSNAYRYFKFAIANEFFQICASNEINWINVWNSLKNDYPRAADLPTPGFTAGPCLVKDTQQLNYYTNNNFMIGKSALKVNENLPDYIVSILEEKYDLSQIVVGILGMTFKGDVDDFRSSLSFKLRDILSTKSKKVYCSDDLIQKDYFVSVEELVELCDLIILATPHKNYKGLKISKPLVDIWRISESKSII
jgi:UDP-N-acetyl-D-mannosaminuronic acid dehydrogenase